MENVENYTLACLALHNYSRLMDNAHYTPSGFVNSEDKDGNFLLGEWRLQKENGLNKTVLVDLPHLWGSRSHHDPLKTRNELRDFPNSEQGSLAWQLQFTRCTYHYAVVAGYNLWGHYL